MDIRHAYLHGLASGPRATKGLHLARAFARHGIDLALPDLNAPSFAELSCTAMLDVLDAMDRQAGPGARWRFVGSSLGGYLAALWCMRHPGRCDALVLLCPGFGLQDRWRNLVGDEGLARWRRDGRLPLPDASGTPVPVHWGLVEDMARHPRVPDVDCPTLIIHGTRDAVVPIAGSRQYAAAHADVRLVEVDDDHPLQGSLPRIEREVLAFFGIADAG
jgi:pimeloyl-ACP methyl ester carboxylesterase